MYRQNPVIVYTIGHSNRSIDEFIAILNGVPIKTLVDVRAHPQSQRYPQFSQQPLRQNLEAQGIVYHWAGKQLGGRRAVNSDSKHIALEDEGLRGYADFMETELFQKAVVQLIQLASSDNTAVMCAEKLPQHCHRNMIADYLLLQGVEVKHIIDATNVLSHQLSPMARRESAQLIYDRGATRPLDI